MVKTISSIVKKYTTMGDKNVYSYFFTKQYHAGCDGHPSVEEQEQIANELAQFLSAAKVL